MVKYYLSFNSIDETQTIDQKDRAPTSSKLFQIQIEGLRILDSNQKENKKNSLSKSLRQRKQQNNKQNTEKGMMATIQVMRKIKTRTIENDNINGSDDNNDRDGAPLQKKTKFEKCETEIKLKKGFKFT